MIKILVEVHKKNISFSLYTSRQKIENINNTNVINTQKMIFSDAYINENIDIIKSFFNLIVLKREIDSVRILTNDLFPLVYSIVEDISNVKEIDLVEDKNVSYIIFEKLLSSKYIERVNCYSIPSFMLDKLDIDKDIEIKTRCEVLYLSDFMEKNNFHSYSDVYYKKTIDVSCQFDKTSLEDIDAFFRFNNKLKVINLYDVDENGINYILTKIKENNKKNIKIVLHQKENNNTIIKLVDHITNKNKKLLKNNNLRLKIEYTNEYRSKNTMKQINLGFFRFILILFIALAISLAVVFYLKYKEDTRKINEELDGIDEAIDLNEIDNFFEEEKNFDDTPLEEEPEKEEDKPEPSEPSPYYKEFNQVFDELLKINDETVGWLKINNTNINYPVVQHSDNEYYLNNSYYKKRNSHGWIFLDYRNNINPLDKNIIIYGHRNNYGVMFANLKKVLDKNWYTNKSNQIITFNTIHKNMKWQIFSIYTLKNTNDYLTMSFANDETFENFLKMIKKRSIYNFKVDVKASDNILTLSTCYNNSEYRLVVHAKLLK